MNDPDHYCAAERLFEEVESSDESSSPKVMWCLEWAKLHMALPKSLQPLCTLTALNEWKSLNAVYFSVVGRCRPVSL